MINQLAFGKTNHGRTLYGRATRHRRVEHCCIGALAFYLSYRFLLTGEFLEFTDEDWVRNERWFNIKLLVDVNGSDLCKEMQNDLYGKHVKRVLTSNNLMCAKVLHLGRNMGAKILDLLEAEGDKIRRMGQWNPSVFDNSYSSKLPMPAIRKLAGYENKVYFNTRTTMYPNDLLRQSTPIGRWCYAQYNNLVARIAETDESLSTALSFLRFMCDLNDVFLQDTAAIFVKLPDRCNHPLFQCMQVFDMPEWKEYVSTMKRALEGEDNPLDASLEAVMRGIQQYHAANTMAINQLATDVQALKVTMNEVGQDIQDQRLDQKRQLASTFMGVAKTLLESASGGAVTLQAIEKGIEKESNQLNEEEEPTASATATRENSWNIKEGKYYLTPRHKTLYDLWDEWHGQGYYYDPEGGPDGRDKEHGSKWRKHIDGQHYSRTKRVVAAIKCYCERNRLKVNEGIAHLDECYQSTNRSVANLVRDLQKKGLLEKKKTRRKTVAAVAAAASTNEESV